METKVDAYLGKVYGVAGLGLAAAAFGSKLHLEGTISGGFVMTLLQIVFLVAIGLTQYSASTQGYKDGGSPLRYGLFFAFAFCIGTNVGTWIEFGSMQAFGRHYALSLRDELVMEAFILSALLFGIFTVAGFLATNNTLFISLVVVGVGSMITFWTSLATLFGLVSFLAFEAVYIKLGLVMASAYVLLDTWRILQQAKAGVHDVITHAITILTDFIQMFIRVLYLLSKSKSEKNKN